MTTLHTPTPYVIADVFIYSKTTNNVLFATKGLSKADQQFIVRACNAHEELLGALKCLKHEFSTQQYVRLMVNSDEGELIMRDIIARVDAAIAKAEGK